MLRANFVLNQSIFATVIVALAVVTATNAQSSDYDAEAETSMSGLSGLGGMSGLTALANGILPVVSGDDISGEVDEAAGDGERGGDADGSEADASDASESSSADSGDFDDGSNDSAASEEHPILSKFMNLIGRKKRSVNQIEAPQTAASARSVHRVKRHSKGWVPYVKTFVKTDKKAHFKWGVKAKVGKKYGK